MKRLAKRQLPSVLRRRALSSPLGVEAIEILLLRQASELNLLLKKAALDFTVVGNRQHMRALLVAEDEVGVLCLARLLPPTAFERPDVLRTRCERKIALPHLARR